MAASFAAGLGYVCSCVMQTLKKDMALFFFSFLSRSNSQNSAQPKGCSQHVLPGVYLTVFTTAAQQQYRTLQIHILIVFVTWLNSN